MASVKCGTVSIGTGDALIIADVQNDFLPGGSLAVADSDEIVPLVNDYAAAFAAQHLPVFMTRDWHPPGHCSFLERGGPWPPHCVAGTPGAEFSPGLRLPTSARIVSKAVRPDREAYSAFEGTDLAAQLRAASVRRIFIGGLTTDYCVLNSAKDALASGYETYVLEDAIRAVNVAPGDGAKALKQMRELGAIMVTREALGI